MEEIILNKIREIEEVCKLTEDYNSLNLHSLSADEYPIALKHCGPWHSNYFEIAVKNVSIKGLWLEFGVSVGHSMYTLSNKTNNKIYGFDSFEGLPEDWDEYHKKGCFSLNGVPPTQFINGKTFNENVIFIKGWFDDTLPEFLKKTDEKIAFLHIDSDLYSSCKTIFTLLEDRIVDGTIICFDDFMEWDYCQNNEIRAFAEYLLDTKTDYEFLAKYREPRGNYIQTCFKIKKNKIS